MIPAHPDDVARICAELPETELGTSWGGVPTWKVPRSGSRGGGRGFVRYRPPHHSAVDPVTGEMYEDLLVIAVANNADKEALVAADGPFFTVDHFRNYNAVLVQQSRLAEISQEELREVITEAWRAVAPRRLVKDFSG